MRLNDKEIKSLLKENPYLISPKPKVENISGVTVDIHLANQFRTFSTTRVPFLDLSQDSPELSKSLNECMTAATTIQDGERFFMHPGDFALGCTLEKVDIPDNIVGWLDGRSSLARLGLLVHISAHRIDPGFKGQVVLEFYNAGKLPLALSKNMKIGAISFERLSGPSERPYSKRKSSKYNGQVGAVSTQIDKDQQ